MPFLFNDFAGWKQYCNDHQKKLWEPVLEYEIDQKGRTDHAIWQGMEKAYDAMVDAVETGLKEDMTSRSGMVNNGGKKVFNSKVTVLSPEFQQLIARALAAKEVNSCMGRIVAAPTAGASGIIPGVLYTIKEIHNIDKQTILEGLLIAAGSGLIIEKVASVSGAVGGCQAETGSAGAMASGAVVYCLGGDADQVFDAVAITIQCMLGLVCDPVAGLVEVPCIVRNASAAAIAFSSAQMALAGVSPVIPVDECVQAMGEIGQSMESRYKETAEGGLAATPTGKAIADRILNKSIRINEQQKTNNDD